MAYNSTNEYLHLLNELGTYHVPNNIIDLLSGYIKSIYQSEIENRFSSPMVWIGLYIAFASLICILAMVADLVHGLRSRKLWFPCKYFRINSFFLTVIAVAMKLPVDLTSSMPGLVDQVTKIGSLAFMCTIMANLIPFLAIMDDNDLYSNMAALGVLVITMVGNVCIQIKTGVVSASTYDKDLHITTLVSPKHHVVSLPKIVSMLPTIYVVLLLMLLILYVCSCFATLSSKKTIESQYQYIHDQASREMQQPSEGFLTIEKLREYVRGHLIMARCVNSQFVFTAYFQTTCASGVICVFVTILHILTMFWTFGAVTAKDYNSDYSWSVIVIVISQLIAIMVGTIAPLCRCFAPIISFDVDSDYLNVFKVESYWTSNLYYWRGAIIGLPSHLEGTIQPFKRLILSVFIGFEVVVVVVCKIVAMSLHYFSICGLSFFHCFKRLLNAMYSSSGEERSDNLNQEDIFFIYYQYVVVFGSELDLTNRTFEGLLNSVKQLIEVGEKNQPHIIDLLEKSSHRFYGFGRLKYLPNLLTIEDRLFEVYQNCWSLQVVTLATIACSLPQIEKNQVDWLLTNVTECLPYVTLVDECFNSTTQYIQKAVKVLWEEVHYNHEWLENKLPGPFSRLSTTQQVVQWFNDAAGETPFMTTNIRAKVIDREHRRILVTSMDWISRSILDRNTRDGDDASQQKLFDRLSSIIADMIAACLTNLPQVIINKCHSSVAEEREASVNGAALLLGQTTQIIETLRQHDIPNINPRDRPFFNKWHAYWTESHIP